jgi:hypothetical protein
MSITSLATSWIGSDVWCPCPDIGDAISVAQGVRRGDACHLTNEKPRNVGSRYKEEAVMPVLHGSCLCGGVKFEINGPLDVP